MQKLQIIKDEIQNLVSYLLNETTLEQKKVIFSFYPFIFIDGQLFYLIKKDLELKYFYNIQTDTLYSTTFQEITDHDLKNKALKHIYKELVTITNQLESFLNKESSK